MINDTFVRIQTRAMGMLQNTSRSTSNANDLLPKVKDWARTRYDRIMRSFPWNELLRGYELSTVSATQDYAMRYDLDSIVKLQDSSGGGEITQLTIQDSVRFSPSDTQGNITTGSPNTYIDMGSKGCSALMSIADKVQVISTSALDVSPKVILVKGEVSGIEISETIILTGTTAADSVNTYDASSEITVTQGTNSGALSDLAGVVTVREKTTSSNVIARLSPYERAPLYRWIRLSPTPASSATIKVWYKRRWMPLNDDNDAPLIPCANEIVEGVVSDALWEDGQETAAQAQDVKFINSVKELWNSTRPRNLITQAYPDSLDGYDGRTFWNGPTY